MVEWLNELIYLHEAHDELYFDFEIEGHSDTRLRATVRGANAHPTKATIKAATFHDLEIQPTEDGYLATIVFDV